jgi:uncharacterized membrane protein YeaQ/YmgE (transglycosylase-associated protein family)
VKAGASGRAWVEIEDAVAPLGELPVAVSKDDNAGVGRWLRHRQLMDDMHPKAGEGEVEMQRQGEAVRRAVVVAAYGVYGRQPCQLFEDLSAADIAGVDNRLNAGKRREQPRVDVAMGVRDDANEHLVHSYGNCYEIEMSARLPSAESIAALEEHIARERDMNILAWIIVGLIAGVVAKSLVPGEEVSDLVIMTLLGIAGAILGGFLATLIGVGGGLEGLDILTILLSVLGAAGLLWAYREYTHGRGVRA